MVLQRLLLVGCADLVLSRSRRDLEGSIFGVVINDGIREEDCLPYSNLPVVLMWLCQSRPYRLSDFDGYLPDMMIVCCNLYTFSEELVEWKSSKLQGVVKPSQVAVVGRRSSCRQIDRQTGI